METVSFGRIKNARAERRRAGFITPLLGRQLRRVLSRKSLKRKINSIDLTKGRKIEWEKREGGEKGEESRRVRYSKCRLGVTGRGRRQTSPLISATRYCRFLAKLSKLLRRSELMSLLPRRRNISNREKIGAPSSYAPEIARSTLE